jgi:hypothetical protein
MAATSSQSDVSIVIKISYSGCVVLGKYFQPEACIVCMLRLSIDNHHRRCLYYKHHNIVQMLQIVASITDDSRGIICIVIC